MNGGARPLPSRWADGIMRPIMRKWRFWIGLAVSLICLVLAAAGIEWRRVVTAFALADWVYLAPALVMLLAYLAARAVRWRILLGRAVPFRDAFAVTNIGYLVSNVLPLRLGDPARAVAIGMGGAVRTSTALSTVVVERVLDMAMVVLLLAVTLPFVGQAGWTRSAGLLGGVAALVALVLLIVAALRPQPVLALIGSAARRIPRLNRLPWQRVLGELLEGLAALRSWRGAGGLIVWTLLTWACTVGVYFFLIRAFIPGARLVQAAFLSCTIGLGMSVPSSPGAVGVFHSVARYALELPFGVARETALAIAFASHAFLYVVMCLLGLAGMVQQNLSLARLESGVATRLAKE